MESLWKQLDVWYVEIGGEMWKILSFCWQTRYHKIDKNTIITVKRYVNELVSLRTRGYLINLFSIYLICIIR